MTLSYSNLAINSQASVNVNNDTLVLNYTGTSPAGAIRTLLVTGFNAGRWNGPGLNSSAAANDATSLTALGYKDTGSSIIIKYADYGDNNLDGVVDTTDFRMFLDGFAGTSGTSWSTGDYTYDNKVDVANDFNLFFVSYLNQGGARGDLASIVIGDSALSASQRGQLLAVIPEPGSLTALGLLTVLLPRRRARIHLP